MSLSLSSIVQPLRITMSPCAEEVKSEKGLHSFQPTKLTFYKEILCHRKVCVDSLSGWLQRPAGDPACLDPSASGHHMSFICRWVPSPYWSSRREARVCHQLLLGVAFQSIPRGSLLKPFPPGNTFVRQRGLRIRIFLLGELPKAIESYLPVCKLFRW